MVLQAYIDDSRGRDGRFVLAGYISTAEKWAEFSEQWEALLPYSPLFDDDGRRYFKMSEMMLASNRRERISAFYRVIEKNVLMALSVSFNIKDLQYARSCIHSSRHNINWNFLNNPYLFAFFWLMDSFHEVRTSDPYIKGRFPLDSKIDFIFDEQSEKTKIIPAWDSFVAGRKPEMQKLYGATPRFEDDKDFLPIQAADFWAWWIRHSYETDHRKIYGEDFELWKSDALLIPKLDISIEREDMVKLMATVARKSIGNTGQVTVVRFDF